MYTFLTTTERSFRPHVIISVLAIHFLEDSSTVPNLLYKEKTSRKGGLFIKRHRAIFPGLRPKYCNR